MSKNKMEIKKKPARRPPQQPEKMSQSFVKNIVCKVSKNKNHQRVFDPATAKGKKAQEEIVGFVLIIVLVSVIAVIFLGISLQTDSDFGSIESQRISSLLSSASQVTTSCELPLSVKKNIGELVVRCFENRVCENSNKPACEVLELDLREMLKESYVVDDNSFTRYYNMTIYSKTSNEVIIKPIISGQMGACPGRLLTNNKPFTSIGIGEDQIIMNLEVCFNS